MKTYPKALADVEALQMALNYLFERADSLSEDADRYKARSEDVEEGESSRNYDFERHMEYQAKAAACIRLAERLAK